jgi:hypothetical protein
MGKKLEDVVLDIYHILENNQSAEGVDVDRICDEAGREVAEAIRNAVSPQRDRRNLRLSAVGKPDRKIYNQYHGVDAEPLRGPTLVKFLYGHVVEAMVLSLVELAGHEVTDKQKEVEVEGVTGHIDCRIDGVLVDVKSSSSYGFKKFRNNELHKDDAFGYIGQLKAYAYAEGDTEYAWLAMDKANGNLAVLKYDETDTTSAYYDDVNWDVSERVREIKKLVESNVVPSVCYEPVPDGKSGNMKLDTGCSYCDFKHTCWPDVQTYLYANGPRYLTKVVQEPRVMGLPSEF